MSQSKNQTPKRAPKSMSKGKTTSIFVGSHGGTINHLPPVLSRSVLDDMAIEEGHIVSEVGGAEELTLKGCGRILSYNLRKSPWKANYLPRWIPGHIDLGESFACFNPINFSLPTVGAKRIINPVVTKIQHDLISFFRTIQAKVCYFIIVSCPIGSAPYMRVRPCEIDDTTQTLGVRWKPSGHNAIAVHMEWSNDHKVILQDSPRKGQSGLSIEVTLMEDNSIETVNTPLNVTAYCYVYGMQGTGWRNSDDILNGVAMPALNFTPAATPAFIATNE